MGCRSSKAKQPIEQNETLKREVKSIIQSCEKENQQNNRKETIFNSAKATENIAVDECETEDIAEDSSVARTLIKEEINMEVVEIPLAPVEMIPPEPASLKFNREYEEIKEQEQEEIEPLEPLVINTTDSDLIKPEKETKLTDLSSDSAGQGNGLDSINSFSTAPEAEKDKKQPRVQIITPPRQSVKDLTKRYSSMATAEDKTTREKSSELEKKARYAELNQEIKDRQSSHSIKDYYETMEDINKECETFRDF